MFEIDWKAKLSSRKFWAALVGFVSPLLLAMGLSQNQAAQIAAIITAGGTLIAYIIGESTIDAAREGKSDTLVSEDPDHE